MSQTREGAVLEIALCEFLQCMTRGKIKKRERKENRCKKRIFSLAPETGKRRISLRRLACPAQGRCGKCVFSQRVAWLQTPGRGDGGGAGGRRLARAPGGTFPPSTKLVLSISPTGERSEAPPPRRTARGEPRREVMRPTTGPPPRPSGRLRQHLKLAGHRKS